MAPLDDLNPDENSRLSERVYAVLVDKIVRGDLPPGKKVSELAIAKHLQVSRTPVHDAVRDLIKDGLVEQRENARPVIAEFTATKVLDLFFMRSLLESQAARLAATQMDREMLGELRCHGEALKGNLTAEQLHEKWIEFEKLFHGHIAEASWNRFLYQDILRYRTIHEVLIRHFIKEGNIEQGLDEHLKILDAIEAHDGDTAAQLMAEHITEWKTYFARKVEETPRNVRK